jgi:hypothetical protein
MTSALSALRIPSVFLCAEKQQQPCGLGMESHRATARGSDLCAHRQRQAGIHQHSVYLLRGIGIRVGIATCR